MLEANCVAVRENRRKEEKLARCKPMKRELFFSAKASGAFWDVGYGSVIPLFTGKGWPHCYHGNQVTCNGALLFAVQIVHGGQAAWQSRGLTLTRVGRQWRQAKASRPRVIYSTLQIQSRSYMLHTNVCKHTHTHTHTQQAGRSVVKAYNLIESTVNWSFDYQIICSTSLVLFIL